MKKYINLSLITILSLSNAYAFSLQEGYQKALRNDVDTQVNANSLETIQYDRRIADSLFYPKIDITAKVESIDNSQNQAGREKSDQYGAKVTQPLFDGFEAKYEKELQDARLLSAKHYLTESQNKLALDYVQSYIDVLKQKKILQLRIENVRISEDIFNKVYKKVQSGYGTKLEFEEAKERYTRSKVDLSIQKLNYRSAIESLKYFVQEEFDSNELMKPNFFYSMPQDLETAMQVALQSNPSYLVAKANLEVAVLEQKRDLKAYYPTVALVGSYDKYDSMVAPASNEYDETKIGLELNYNLYNGGKDDALNQKAHKKIHEKKLLITKSENQLENKVRLSWNSYELNQEKNLKQQSYTQAKKNVLESTIQEFDLGLQDLTTLMDEHQSYITAKSDLIASSYDYMLAQYKVLESVGTLSNVLGDTNLTLEKQFSENLMKEMLENSPKKVYVDTAKEKKIVQPKEEKITQNPLVALLTPVKPVIKETIKEETVQPQKTEQTLASFQEQFLNASIDKYTINLAYAKTDYYAQKILDNFELNDKAFFFSFGKQLEHRKVMYGIFDSKAQAQEALKNLPKGLQSHQPRVESVSVKQTLFHKYHSDIPQKKNSTPIDEKKIVARKEVIENKTVVKKQLATSNFKELFLNADSSKYTINLAYADNIHYAKHLMKKFDLQQKAFFFSFGEKRTNQKIMMGVYDSQDEAMQALNDLPADLLKKQPRIESISIKQKLYHKYHSDMIDKKVYVGSL